MVVVVVNKRDENDGGTVDLDRLMMMVKMMKAMKMMKGSER